MTRLSIIQTYKNIHLKKLVTIFILAFIFNLIWENLHANLYVHYKSGTITQAILIHAALFDAIFTTIISGPFIFSKYFSRHLWYILIIGIVYAIILERWALATNRWSYNDLMPIIPILKTGLTPTLQLGLLSLLVLKITKINKSNTPL